MKTSIKEILKSSALGVLGKVLTAGLNFFSLPLLIAIYGKPNFGLIGVALSTNAFLQIVHMGVPTGAVKNFAEWIEAKNFGALKNGMQTNLFFFTLVGLINSGILIYIAFHTGEYFNVSEPEVLKKLILILSLTSFLNWYFIGFQHLLMAYEKVSSVNIANSIVSLFNFGSVLLAYYSSISLVQYFLIYSFTNLIVIPVVLLSCHKIKVLKKDYFFPFYRKSEFKIIMGYSLGLFGMAIFQYMANQSQPLILGAMATNGDVEVANYRILQNVTMLISIMGGIFLQSFLPYISKINYRGDQEKMRSFAVVSTKWLSTFIFFISLFIALNSERILHAYVGENAKGLSIWLSIWMIGLLYLNNQGISSIILGLGRFREVLIGLFFASTFAIGFSLLNVKSLGVGIAAISYLGYKTIEAIFIYAYYLPKVAKISPKTILTKSVLPPLLISVVSIGTVKLIFSTMSFSHDLLYLALNGISCLAFNLLLIYYFILTGQEKAQIRNVSRLKSGLSQI